MTKIVEQKAVEALAIVEIGSAFIFMKPCRHSVDAPLFILILSVSCSCPSPGILRIAVWLHSASAWTSGQVGARRCCNAIFVHVSLAIQVWHRSVPSSVRSLRFAYSKLEILLLLFQLLPHSFYRFIAFHFKFVFFLAYFLRSFVAAHSPRWWHLWHSTSAVCVRVVLTGALLHGFRARRTAHVLHIQFRCMMCALAEFRWDFYCFHFAHLSKD